MRGLAAIVAALAAPLAIAGEELVTLPTRDTSISYLLVQRAPAAKPAALALSFVGGDGVIDLAKRARENRLRFGPGANFLIRARDDLVSDDVADAIVDVPADRLPGGLADADRLGREHAHDVAAVVDDLGRRFPGVPVFLVGTSRGTVSAAALAVALGSRVRGVVLTSTVTVADREGPGLSGFDFSAIAVPVLLVHHRDDGCRSSPYFGVKRLGARFPLVTVSGGDAPRSGPCEPRSAHGFFGREAQTMRAIRDWMLGRDVARDISALHGASTAGAA